MMQTDLSSHVLELSGLLMRTHGRSSDLHYKYGPFSFLQGLADISNVAASLHFQRPKHITCGTSLLGLTHGSLRGFAPPF